jgi:polar amino acid transport system substrate-binding protein
LLKLGPNVAKVLFSLEVCSRQFSHVTLRSDFKKSCAAGSDLADFALPQLSSGKLDADRAMRMYTVVFVRARDMIPDGGHDGPRNLEKLARGRIDGYAATLVSPTRMDAYIAARFGKQLLQLAQPLRIHHFWLGFSKRYYERNRPQVEAMWNWMGAHGHARFVELVEQYEKTP